MSLDQVDEDNRLDVEGWHRQGIYIESLESVKPALLLSAKGMYRVERDYALSFAVAYAEREVGSSYSAPDATLRLIRAVGFTDAVAGISYNYPLVPVSGEAYVGAELGIMFARADAEAYGTRTEKVSDSTQTFVTVDTKGAYGINKLILNATAGVNIHILDPLFINLDARYKLGKVGKLEGDVRRFSETRTEETSIEFDYSGFFLTVGIGVAF